MFKKDNRYVTGGINEKINIRLQVLMWNLIDDLKAKADTELDYLQVFILRKEMDFVIIEHSQEVPEYRDINAVYIEGVEVEEDIKIYVIDNEEYSTMLLAEEY